MTLELRKPLFDSFVTFARAQVLVGDIDPTVVLLREHYRRERLKPEIALWRSLLFVTWYHLGSAEKIWKLHPEPGPIDADRFASLPTGVERRGFRGLEGNKNARAFVAAVLGRAGGSLLRWTTSAGTGLAGWEGVRRELESVAGAGPWASARWATLVRNIHQISIAPERISVMAGAPISAMAQLTGIEERQCARSAALQREVLLRACEAGAPLSGLDQLEATLGAFHQLCRGNYYLGHEIDAQMESLATASRKLWNVRDVFPDQLRGELGRPPWTAVRKNLKKTFSTTGQITNL